MVAVSLAMAAPSQSETPKPDPALDAYLTPQTLATLPDGRHISFFCLGTGKVTAILLSGWNVSNFVWRDFQLEASKKTRVCVYDRAGYGFSDPGPLPRDSSASVEDLHAALRAANLSPPYVLIGHSLGGFDARLYAYRYSQDLAGVILLDPPDETKYLQDHTPDEDVAGMQHCLSLLKNSPIAPDGKDGCVEGPGPEWSPAMQQRLIEDQEKPAFFETLISEDVSMVNQSAQELATSRRSLGKLQIFVLQADGDCNRKHTQDDKDFSKRCIALKSQANDSSNGNWAIVKGADHYIFRTSPDVVLSALSQILRAQ